MKKKPKKDAAETSGKKSPGKPLALQDPGEQLMKARYGSDAHNTVMWHLINARTHLVSCRVRQPDEPLANAMFDNAELQGRESIHWSIRIGFYEAASKAILDGDFGFFQEVARLLEERIDSPPDRRVDEAVIMAFTILSNSGDKLPTKKQVKERAMWEIAFGNVIDRMPGPNAYMEAHHYPKEGGRLRMKPSVAKEVEREIDRLPEQNWTAIFKRCGLSHLPNDKGGQPSHRKSPYCR